MAVLNLRGRRTAAGLDTHRTFEQIGSDPLLEVTATGSRIFH
jgi:hypothetical protein